MDILVEHRPGGVQVIVQGPEGSEELLRIVSLLRADDRRLWGWDEQRTSVALSPAEIVWAEMVDGKVFVYMARAMYQTSLSLGELEGRWEDLGLFRCAKSTVINLNAVRSLRSRPGGRIEAALTTGERVIVSRRYAPLLRERIQERG